MELKVKIFADGAEKTGMLEMYNNPLISGFTTNPTLMRKAGVKNYKEFALEILAHIKDKPISFEVFSDEFDEMKDQALEISSWGKNVYIKIPITNTRADSSYELVESLSEQGVKINVTAMFTVEQVNAVQANENGCHNITPTNDILKKLPSLGKDLTEFSLDTVKMFYNDAKSVGYTI